MTKNSFSIGNHNSADDWGILVKAHDFLLPQKRARKVTIPGRSGAYSYGSQEYDERSLRLDCTLTRKISKAQLREIAYALSQRGRISLYNEPDKYYIGEIYDAAEVVDYPTEAMRDFEIWFVCEPFAYSRIRTLPIVGGQNRMEYAGTAKTPCLIVLRNTGQSPVANIQLRATYRR